MLPSSPFPLPPPPSFPLPSPLSSSSYFSLLPLPSPHLELRADISDVPLIVHHIHKRQPMSLPTVIVVVVVSRRDLDCPSTKVSVHHLIRNDRQLPLTEGMRTVLTNQVLK